MMKYRDPAIEQINWHDASLIVTVADFDCPPSHRRPATSEETQQAILYWLKDIHDRIGGA
jgi:hypothetical protein